MKSQFARAGKSPGPAPASLTQRESLFSEAAADLATACFGIRQSLYPEFAHLKAALEGHRVA